MEVNPNKNELHLYPVNDHEYMAKIFVDGANVCASETVVILDTSGSMNDATARFVKEILPMVMSKMGYAENYGIHLITFASQTTYKFMTRKELLASKITSKGSTKIGPAIETLRLTLAKMQKEQTGRPIRVLTISDGEISDAVSAVRESKKLTEFLAASDLTINSQAVRLFTSDNQPDTKALSYLLQINNTTVTNLSDLKAAESDQTIANAIVPLFELDYFNKYQTLQFDKSIILKYPWNSAPSSRMLLAPGWNTFWLKMAPTGAVKLGSGTIKVIPKSQLDLPMFHQLMETKLAYIADHMTILKVVGTTEANRSVEEIYEYFKMKEQELALKCSTPNNKLITNMLDGIAKNKTNFSDSAQMAEFLRKTNKEIADQRQREVERRKIEEEERRKRAENERLKREEENRKQREEDERKQREEVERKQREEDERKQREEDERKQREEDERKQREEDERKQREEDERLKQEEDERLKREEENRKQREEDERLKREEENRKQREEDERKQREEDERKQREEDERKQREEDERFKQEEGELLKQEEENRKQREEERIKLEELDRLKLEELDRLKLKEQDRVQREEDIDTTANSLVMNESMEINSPNNSSISIRTVHTLDEHHMDGSIIETMEINRNKNELHLYPINDNEHVGAIYMDSANLCDLVHTLVVLSTSESMKNATTRFVKEILPLVMSNMGHSDDYGIHLITFASQTTYQQLKRSELIASGIRSGGDANIGPAIESLRETLEKMHRDHPKEPIRVLTISDGEISDIAAAANESKKLREFLATSDLSINSQAVRLFSSDEQPDTKALSYMLQINNTSPTNLCDLKITASNATIAKKIVSLFELDHFKNHQTLQFENAAVLKYPWHSIPTARILLSPGWNVFWLKVVPTSGWNIFRSKIEPIGAVKLGDDTIKVITEKPLSLPTFHQLMETKLAYIADHMTILKVVGTTETDRIVDQIVEYFKLKEDELALKSSTTNNKFISNLLDEIAKNKRDLSDSAEMAEFIRKTNKEVADQRQKELERRKREEKERIQLEEDERLKKEEEQRKQREEENRKQREEDERLKREEEIRIQREEESKLDHLKLEEQDRVQREEETETTALVITESMEINSPNNSSISIRTVPTLDEHHMDGSIIKTIEINRNKNELHLYPINDNEHVGAIYMDSANLCDVVHTLVVLNTSESMKNATTRFVKEILPLVMSNMGYSDDYGIHLITFASQTTYQQLKRSELITSGIRSGGDANIGPAIESLRETLEKMHRDHPKEPIRVLTISDGEISDIAAAANESKKLREFLATSDLSINSQAVRLFTSDEQPDTKALSYMLQINNTSPTNLCDLKITASNATIAKKIVSLFELDHFKNHQTLQFENATVLKYPWHSIPTTRILLSPGWNVFWLKVVPTSGWNIFRSKMEPIGAVKLGDDTIKVITEKPLNLPTFHQLMETKLAYIADHMTILKVVGSSEADTIVDQIVEYFKLKEDELGSKSSTPSNNFITNLLDEIAKNKIDFSDSDSAEMAEFIRRTNMEVADQRQKELRKREEDERRKREEDKRIQLEEDERLKREENERLKREEAERIQLEEEERLKLENSERIQREEKEHLRLEEETQINPLVITESTEIDLDAIQTYFMRDEQHLPELHLYPINDNEHIGAIHMNSENMCNLVHTLVILSASESMKEATARFVREIVPLVMSKLGYLDYCIHLITFASQTTYKFMSRTELIASDITSGGAANIGPAIESLRQILEKMHRDHSLVPLRVLTISDGEIDDAGGAAYQSKKLIDFLATSDLMINSQAVRLFTSDKQPDTKALSYLLQINNTTPSNLCDVKATASNETIANAIVPLFEMDHFKNHQTLHFENAAVLKYPWHSVPSTRIFLAPEWNIFWLKLMPTGEVKLGGDTIKIITESQVDLPTFHQLMETKLAYIADHMTILKVVGSSEANRTVNQIFEYIKVKEDELALKSSTPGNKFITNLLDGIVKNKTKFSDSAQMAEFIRKTNKEIADQREMEKEPTEIEEYVRIEREALLEVPIKRFKRDVAKCLTLEEVERLKREGEELLKREEEERLKREEEERLKIEEEERLKIEKEERLKREEEERRKLDEYERLKREEEERSKHEEEERLKREEEERLRQEEENRKREEKEMRKEMDRMEREEQVRLEREKEYAQREEQERMQREEEEERVQHEEDSETTINSLVTTGAIDMNPVNSNSIQTVFILDERHTAGAKNSRRFMEKIIPLMLLKLFYESLQLVHLVTFVRHKTTVEEMFQSLLQTLDAKKQIRIFLLANGEAHERLEIENLAETLIKFLSGTNYSFELQVVRLASTKRTTKRYKLVDIDPNESNEFIASQIAGYACDNQSSADLHIQNYVEKTGVGNFCSFHFTIFVIIFAVLIVRFTYMIK